MNTMILSENKHGGTRRIMAVDAPSHGNAHHEYAVMFESESGNSGFPVATIRFQKGAVKEPGSVNGLFNEDLLAIVANRLLCFQTSSFACRENAEALEAVQTALRVLAERTARRTQAGTEGTHQGN